MTIGYEITGAGAHHVLVLHGWFGDHAMFAPMRDALSLDEFTYAAVDYRGYGASKAMTGAYDVGEIAADVLAVADNLGWDNFSLVGHSMGGKFIQRIIADQPRRVRRAVAITPVPAAAVPFDEQSWALFEGAAASLDNRRAIIDFTTGGRLSKSWIDAMARHSEATSTREAFAAYLLAWAKADFHQAVIGAKTPIKVIVGQYDGAINAETMQATFLQWFPNAELDVMPNAGHYPMNETPVALATGMEAFLRA